MYYIKRTCSICSQSLTRINKGWLVGWLVCQSYRILLVQNCQPALKLNDMIFCGFEESLHSLTGSPEENGVTSVAWPLTPPTPYLFIRKWSYSQGILGFVDHTGNLLLLHMGPCHKEWTLIITVGSPAPPIPSSPTSCLYITLTSPAAHLRPDVFTLSPFFNVSGQNKPRLWELDQSCKELPMVDSWLGGEIYILGCKWSVCGKGRLSLKEISRHCGNLILQGLEGLPLYDMEKEKC